MKNIKLSTKGFAMVFAFVAFIAVCAGFLGYTAMDTNKQLNVQATVGTVNVTFSGFPATTEAFCVVSFYHDSTVERLLFEPSATNPNGAVVQNLTQTAGKLEITVPMYASIEGLTANTYTPNGSTYYMDIASAPDLTIKVTYKDSGYFGSSVVI